jgi:hypothetical protein
MIIDALIKMINRQLKLLNKAHKTDWKLYFDKNGKWHPELQKLKYVAYIREGDDNLVMSSNTAADDDKYACLWQIWFYLTGLLHADYRDGRIDGFTKEILK